MRKPRALREGDRVAVVAPASPFARDEFDAGVAELRALGFEPVFEETVFERRGYVAGSPETRAAALVRAWEDPSVAAIVAARGGYGSAQLLPLLPPEVFAQHAKAFVGYSDTSALLSWLTLACGVVSFHGPMLERRLGHKERGYDRDTFARCLCRPEPVGAISHPALETLHPGEADGMLIGGTLTQIAASLGTPYAFVPPAACVLFLEDVGERPYRIDRLLTQLQQAGILARASALVFGEFPECDEPGGTPAIRDVIEEIVGPFGGPVLFGLPSGHTAGPTLTLPFGVHARVLASATPEIIVTESAVSAD